MGRYIDKTESYELLELLRRIDDGDVPTQEELEGLNDIWGVNFSGCDLTELPESIGMLSQLTTLFVYFNELTSLPESIGKLSLLTHLDVSYNELEYLPESVGKLSLLTDLDASNNILKDLPGGIADLSRLTTLDVSENELDALPEGMDQLSALSTLNISNNRFISLPDGIGKLPSLTTLSMYYNELTDLPESIGALTGLESLDISHNPLECLPGSVCELTGLTELDISYNRLKGLPENMFELPRLRKLNVSHNELTGLPDGIENLFRLKELDISYNKLTSLPNGIFGLSQLTVLNAGGNRLASLPGSIGRLAQLKGLSIFRNRLVDLPDSIGELSQLTDLNLSDNPLKTLPDSIGRLSGLEDLSIWAIGLREIPEFIRNLAKLRKLDVGYNPLKTLPEWVGTMPELETLDLSHLQLTQLPRSLLNLNMPFWADGRTWYRKNNGEGINLMDTTLSLQPVSLFDQSRDQSPDFRESRKLIEDYFDTPKVPIREAKVIFLGDGKVGKTYTIQRLLHDCRQGAYPTKETHGILIEDLYTEKDGESYKIRIWDFGGQDIMHEMHRCFLTDRTCYVVMVDTRTDKQTGRARYWLRTVQSIAPGAPVLLLVNEISGGKNRDLDYTGLMQEFPNLAGVEFCSAMDADDGEFRRKVAQAIFRQALDLDSCKMELPKSWEMVRQNLLSLHDGADPERDEVYYIDRKTFHDLCDQYDVPADDGLRAWLLTWFNDLGVCFSYHRGEDGQEQSEDYKILDPMWLTSAVYKIIWEKEQTDDGLISLGEIYRILEKPGSDAMKKDGIPCLENVSYNQKECGYVLDIMRMFRISYPADERTEFMPTLCKPDSKLDPVPRSWVQHAAYRFRYTFLPENVLHRLMIYCFANLRPGRRWRKGFWLECEAQGLSAVIRDSEANELWVEVYAQKQEFEAWIWLQPLCRQIAEINNTLSLKAEVSVLAANDHEEKWFLLDSVWYWRKQGAQSLQGDRSLFPIQPLMNLIYGKYYPGVEKSLMTEREGRQPPLPMEMLPENVTARLTDLTGLDLSRPFEDQPIERLIAGVERNNSLREKELELLQRGAAAIRENTLALQENSLTIRQSNELLEAVRDGRVTLPQEVITALAEAFRQNDSAALQDAGEKMKRHPVKDGIRVLRELLGDAANFATVVPVVVQMGKTWGPVLAELVRPVLPI